MAGRHQDGRERIIVGDDGSAHAATAVAWAAAHAAATGKVLCLAHAVKVPMMGGVGWHAEAAYEAGRLLHALEDDAQQQLARRVQELGSRWPGLEIETCANDGDAREVLPREAGPGDLLVVGTRGQGAVRALLLGSVSGYLVQHATEALVVVREPAPGARGVLVARGTADDVDAVGFGVAYAAAHGVPLTVLHAAPSGRDTLDAHLAAATRRHPDLVVDVEGVEALDVGALLSAAAGRELLVVERHARRSLLRQLVATVERAPCPVAVLPARGHSDGPAGE